MRLRTTIALITCLLTTSLYAQDSGFTISGELKNLPDGVMFYLIHNGEGGRADTVDRTISKDQRFVFKGRLINDGQLRFVKMDTSMVKLQNQQDKTPSAKQTWLRLFVDNSSSIIKLAGEVKDWPFINIQGSVLTKQHDQFVSNMSAPIAQLNTKIDSANRDSVKISFAILEFNESWLKGLSVTPDSYVVPLLLLNAPKLSFESKETAYGKMSEKLKTSYYGKRLKQQIENLRASKTIGIGKMIPDFQIKTPDGKMESVSSLAKKSKYTLVDFWASWCKPCREDIPNMKKVYQAFNDKGFNIISISTDTNPKAWEKALKEENTPWSNGIQLNRESDNIFGVIGIPAYMLLNEKGEILVMDMTSKYFQRKSVGKLNGTSAYMKGVNERLRGEDLYKTMERLLGEGKSK